MLINDGARCYYTRAKRCKKKLLEIASHLKWSMMMQATSWEKLREMIGRWASGGGGVILWAFTWLNWVGSTTFAARQEGIAEKAVASTFGLLKNGWTRNVILWKCWKFETQWFIINNTAPWWNLVYTAVSKTAAFGHLGSTPGGATLGSLVEMEDTLVLETSA